MLTRSHGKARSCATCTWNNVVLCVTLGIAQSGVCFLALDGVPTFLSYPRRTQAKHLAVESTYHVLRLAVDLILSHLSVAGMASLVELEFAAVNHADALSNRLQDQLESDVRTLEEIWKKLEPLPTPPLSPERGRVSPRAQEDEDYECYESDGVPEDPLLGELLQCEKLLAYEEEYLSGDSQNVQPDFQASLIIQDCLLSDSKTYEPRSSLSSTSGSSSSSGVYTPSPSPPPLPTCPHNSDEISDPPSTDCISPTAVFPAFVPSKPEKLVESASRKERPQRRATTSCINTRVQPQAMASESGERKADCGAVDR